MTDNNERNLSGTPKQVAWANDILNKWEEKWFGTIFEEPYKKFISKYTHAGNIIDLMHKGFFKKIVKKHFNVSSIALVVPNELVKSISSYREGDTLRRVVLELPADIRYVLYDWCNLTYKEGFAKKGECVYFETYEDAISEKNGFTKFSLKFNLKYDDIRMGCNGNVRIDYKKFYFCDENGNATTYINYNEGTLLSVKSVLKAIKESI